MVLFLPLVLVLFAEIATLAAVRSLRKTYDSDFYLPGGVAFAPQGQNRKLLFACLFELLAWSWWAVWVAHRSDLLKAPAWLVANQPSAIGICGLYLAGMLLLLGVGRHLGRFSDLRMTLADGSEVRPGDLMRPLSLALNAYGTLVLLLPLLLYLRF